MFRFWMVPEGFGWSMRVLDGPWWFWMVPDGRDGWVRRGAGQEFNFTPNFSLSQLLRYRCFLHIPYMCVSVTNHSCLIGSETSTTLMPVCRFFGWLVGLSVLFQVSFPMLLSEHLFIGYLGVPRTADPIIGFTSFGFSQTQYLSSSIIHIIISDSFSVWWFCWENATVVYIIIFV